MLRTLTLPFIAALLMLTTATEAQADPYAAFNQAVEAYNHRVQRHESAAQAFNNERISYNNAVARYNSLPADQQTQFMSDRLDRWLRYLKQRLTALDNEFDYLQRRKQELEAWRARLQ